MNTTAPKLETNDSKQILGLACKLPDGQLWTKLC